jgi:sugar lactone lactonase YvrE
MLRRSFATTPLLTLAIVTSSLACSSGGSTGPGSTSSASPAADAGPLPSSDASGAGATGPTADAGQASEGPDGATGASDAAIEPGTINFAPGVVVSTLAGSNVPGSQDGTGAAAEFDNPTGMAVDGQGNLVVTDYDDGRVRLVTPAGVVTTIATAANFVNPFDAVVATDGTYYVGTDADSQGVKGDLTGTIWRVVPVSGSIATPTVVAQGFARPRGLAPSAGGNLFVSDRDESVVDLLTAATGSAAVVAGASGTTGFLDGTGNGARFNSPVGAAALPDGSFAVADMDNNRIRRVTAAGVVTTLAGDGTPSINDGPALAARFNAPRDVAADAAGNVYVSDAGNHCIRRIGTDGTVDTLAGNGTAGFNDGAGSVAELYGQEGIGVTADGKVVYVADGNGGDGSAYHRVRALALP